MCKYCSIFAMNLKPIEMHYLKIKELQRQYGFTEIQEQINTSRTVLTF